MIVTAVAALVLTPFARSAPEERGPRFFSGLTVLTLLLIGSCRFLVDRDMKLMTFLVLLGAATVSSWFNDAWREEWYAGIILFGALTIPLPLSWWTMRWVNTHLRCGSREGHEAATDRPYPSPLMILLLAVWCGLAVFAFAGMLSLRSGIGP